MVNKHWLIDHTHDEFSPKLRLKSFNYIHNYLRLNNIILFTVDKTTLSLTKIDIKVNCPYYLFLAGRT